MNNLELHTQDVLYITHLAFKSSKNLEVEIKIPKIEYVNKNIKSAKVSKIYFADKFVAIDITFFKNTKNLLTIELLSDGTYCSIFDNNYKHKVRLLDG